MRTDRALADVIGTPALVWLYHRNARAARLGTSAHPWIRCTLAMPTNLLSHHQSKSERSFRSADSVFGGDQGRRPRLIMPRPTMRSFQFELFADFSQFYIQDEPADGNLGDSWSDDALLLELAVTDGTVGVGTQRPMDVPVVLEVHDVEPAHDFDGWDMVSECSISVDSGRLVVAGCTEYFPDAARVQIEPGTYRVRVSHGNLESVSSDGLEGEDHYRLQLWLGDACDPRAVKRRSA